MAREWRPEWRSVPWLVCVAAAAASRCRCPCGGRAGGQCSPPLPAAAQSIFGTRCGVRLCRAAAAFPPAKGGGALAQAPRTAPSPPHAHQSHRPTGDTAHVPTFWLVAAHGRSTAVQRKRGRERAPHSSRGAPRPRPPGRYGDGIRPTQHANRHRRRGERCVPAA